jgi:kinetochore protein Spc25
MTTIHVRRPLQINLHALLHQQTPAIDLGVQFYEESTRNFLEAVTKYKMTAITERRRHQAQERKRILDRTADVESETALCKLKEVKLVAHMSSVRSVFLMIEMGLELEREKEERKDAELSVAAFKRQLASLKDKLTCVEADVEHYRTIVQNLRRGPSSSSTTSCFT